MRYLIFAVLLSGCVMSKLQNRLEPFVGKDIHTAIAKLGYPNETRVIVGDTVYTWVTDYRAPYPCKVEMVAGAGGIVKTYSLEGTEIGCKRYNDSLDE